MIEGYSPFLQAALGTLFTWGLTALGSALVFVFKSSRVCITTAKFSLSAAVSPNSLRSLQAAATNSTNWLYFRETFLMQVLDLQLG